MRTHDIYSDDQAAKETLLDRTRRRLYDRWRDSGVGKSMMMMNKHDRDLFHFKIVVIITAMVLHAKVAGTAESPSENEICNAIVLLPGESAFHTMGGNEGCRTDWNALGHA